MATAICSICTHPRHAEIDAALMSGGKLIPVAAAHSVSKSALGRHRQFCLAPKVQAAAKALQSPKEVKAPVERYKAIAAGATPTIDEVLSLTALLERLGRSLDRLENGAVSAATNELHASHAALAGQLHRGIEAAGKLRGFYSDAPQAQQDKFSVQIVIPQLGAAPVQHAMIDCTAESGEPPQVTARRATARSLGFDEKGDD